MSVLPPYERPAELLLHEEERGGRAIRVEVRPGMSEGHYLGISVSAWGLGKGCVCNGEPHYFTARAHAMEAGERWLSEGKR